MPYYCHECGKRKSEWNSPFYRCDYSYKYFCASCMRMMLNREDQAKNNKLFWGGYLTAIEVSPGVNEVWYYDNDHHTEDIYKWKWMGIYYRMDCGNAAITAESMHAAI